jgi:hypothetical protein
VRVPTLAARHVEDSGPERKAGDLENASDFLAVPLQAEERLVLQQISGIEERRPPLASGTP